MTTLLYDRRTKTIGVDSKNTDDSSQVFLTNKIERLENGSYFLGSGHLYTIGKAKRWAETGFDEEDRPEFGELFTENAEDFGFSCIVISEDGDTVTIIDNEMEPYEVLDDVIGTGSGGGYAKAARLGGATMEQAVEIAISIDSNSGGPVRMHVIE
jgi:hypothetical protein